MLCYVGFGSMLRAIGAQIEKTTNREACRDLSGRRMRDINNEKQLKDWMAKQKDREKERARRREEKAARRRAEPLHKFEDKLYDQQKEKVSQDLDAALQQGSVKFYFHSYSNVGNGGWVSVEVVLTVAIRQCLLIFLSNGTFKCHKIKP